MNRYEWAKQFREAVKNGEVTCLAGCGDRATVARVTGKRIGGFCRGCWREIDEGSVPPLDRPKGLRSPVINRKRLMG